MSIPYGRVTFRAQIAQPDASTGSRTTQPLTGTVTFKHSVGYVLDTEDDITIFQPPEQYGLDANGILRDGAGESQVTLAAGWWTADFQLSGVSHSSFPFEVKANETLNLTDVTPIGKINEIPVVRGGDGRSAYQVAVDNGFTGTVEEWLQSLIGGAGNYALQGHKHVAADITDFTTAVQDVPGFGEGTGGGGAPVADSTDPDLYTFTGTMTADPNDPDLYSFA